MSSNGGGEFGQVDIVSGPSIPVTTDSNNGPTASILGSSINWKSIPGPLSLAPTVWREAAASAAVTVTAAENSRSSSSVFNNLNVERPDLDTRIEFNSKLDDHSIYNTCSILTTVCDHLDLLGISFKAALLKAMEFKYDSNRMLETFQAPELKLLMEYVLQKMKVLADESSENKRESFKEFVHQMTMLIERTKSLSQPPESSENGLYGLDIERIAKETLGQNNPFIVNDIKNRLLVADVRIDSDQFCDIFKAVTTLQFDMTSPDLSEKVLHGLNIESIAKETLGKDNLLIINDIKNHLSVADVRIDSDQLGEIFKSVTKLQFNMLINN